MRYNDVVRMPGSVAPQSTDIWEGGSLRGTVFALALLTEVGQGNARIVKLGRIAFDSLPEDRKGSYLRKYYVTETGSSEVAEEILRSDDYEGIVTRATYDTEGGAEMLMEAISIADSIAPVQ